MVSNQSTLLGVSMHRVQHSAFQHVRYYRCLSDRSCHFGSHRNSIRHQFLFPFIAGTVAHQKGNMDAAFRNFTHALGVFLTAKEPPELHQSAAKACAVLLELMKQRELETLPIVCHHKAVILLDVAKLQALQKRLNPDKPGTDLVFKSE